MAGPPPHRESPPGFHSLSLPLATIAAQQRWVRLYGCGHGSVLHFNRDPTHRFNAPNYEYGILYAGDSIGCAFVETFGDDRGPAGTIEVQEGDVRRRCVAHILASRPLTVVDLTGPGLVQIGADARLVTGDDYPQSRRWALALWGHPAAPDGILYVARRDPSRTSLALFDRASAAVQEERLGSLFDPIHQAELNELLDTYKVALL